MAYIYIYSQSGAVRQGRLPPAASKRLRSPSHEIEIRSHALPATNALPATTTPAGRDERCRRQRGAQVAMTCGSYGLTWLLPRLPYGGTGMVERGNSLVAWSDLFAT